MSKWVLVKACDGIIGPTASCPPQSMSYHSFEEALKEMIEDIEGEGGGDYNEDFGYGASENGYSYEIFMA